MNSNENIVFLFNCCWLIRYLFGNIINGALMRRIKMCFFILPNITSYNSIHSQKLFFSFAKIS